MTNTPNKNDDDKLKVITADEVLEEIRRRQKLYGSPFLPSNSYQKLKTPIKIRTSKKQEEIPTSDRSSVNTNKRSGSKMNSKDREALKKAVNFLGNFAFKRPLQSVIATLLFLGITTGIYVALQPVGTYDNRNLAAVYPNTYLGIKDNTNNDIDLGTNPNVFCKVSDLTSVTNCGVNRIYTNNVKKVVVLSKPDFLSFSFDATSQRLNVTRLRELTSGEISKGYPIKLLGISNDQLSHKLLNFTLYIKLDNTNDIPLTVTNYLRAPLDTSSGSNCFVNDLAISRSKWKSYSTLASCIAASSKPVITTASALTLNYETTCKNSVTSTKTLSFDVNATDSDTDFTYFEVSSPSNNVRLEKNLETYTQTTVSDVENTSQKWESYTFKNKVKLDVTPSDIGKTISIKVKAINLSFPSQFIEKTIDVKIGETLTGLDPAKPLTPVFLSPAVSEIIKGTKELNFSFSNNCDLVRYKVEAWDKYCTTFKAVIAPETVLNTVSNGTNIKLSYDTRKLTDSNYCLRVFARNTTTEAYRVANTGGITVQNSTNRSPSIISLPQNTSIKVGDNFNYEIKTTDADNDTVTLEFNKKPSFLTLNGTTLSGSTTLVGRYDVSFRAKDSKGAYSNYQIFKVNVSGTTNTPSVVSFTSFPTTPQKGSIVVKWNSVDNDGIKSLVIYIISDNENWTKLADLKPTDKEYTLDTTKHTDGEYYIKLTLTDNLGEVTDKVSPKLEIVQTTSSSTSSQIVITLKDYEPSKDSKTFETKPSISANFVLPSGVTLDSAKLKVLVDETDISKVCKLESTSFKCTLEKDLEIGQHKVSVDFFDDKGNKYQDSWSFEVEQESSSSASSKDIQSIDSSTVTILGRTIQKNLAILLLVLCLAGLLIFIVPIIIYRFFGKKDKDPDLEDPSSPKTPIEPGSERLTIMPDINKDTHIVRSPYSSAENAHREAQNGDNNLSFQSQNQNGTLPKETESATPQTSWGLAERIPTTEEPKS